MENVIYRPQNPYVGQIRVFPGTLIKVSGKPSVGAWRFSINLQLGPRRTPRDDIALHLSPSFVPQLKITRNSLVNNVWDNEECYGNFMLMEGVLLEAMILVEEEEFLIAFNGSHYCKFKHRVDYREITYLVIDGDLEIERISVSDSRQHHHQHQHQHEHQQPVYGRGEPVTHFIQPAVPLFQQVRQPFIRPAAAQCGPAPSVPYYSGAGGNGHHEQHERRDSRDGPAYPHVPHAPVGPTPSAPFYGARDEGDHVPAAPRDQSSAGPQPSQPYYSS